MALRIILGAFAVLHAINAQQQEMPACLSFCMAGLGIFTPCVDDALHKLMPCFIRGCPDPAASQSFIAGLDLSFSPKAEVSCQQAYGPSNIDKESSSVTLPLNGSCVTSPYGFQSYLPHGVSPYNGTNGCKIMVFSQEDCLGQTVSSDLGKMTNDHCVVDGGRSARLACESDYDAAVAYIQASCGQTNGGGPDDTSSSSTTIYPSSAPYHGPGPTLALGPGTVALPTPWTTTDTTSSTQPATSATGGATGTGVTSSDSDMSTRYTLPLPTGTVSINFTLAGNSTSPATTAQNSTQTSLSSPESQNATSSYSLTLTGTPTATSTPLPPYTGLAAACLRGGAQIGFALGLVGVAFAMFL